MLPQLTRTRPHTRLHLQAYKFLQTIFPGLELWRFDDDRCPVCQAEDYQREQDGQPAKEQADKEKVGRTVVDTLNRP